MYCHQCGTQLPDHANYCAKCGAKAVSVTGHLTPAGQRAETSTLAKEDTRARVQPAAVASPATIDKLIVLRHVLGMGLVGLVNPVVWRSPTFMFAVGVVLVPWVIAVVIAAIVTGACYAFFTDAMKVEDRGVTAFLLVGWIFTGLALIGRLLS